MEQCSLESRTIRWVFARDEAARDLSICNDDNDGDKDDDGDDDDDDDDDDDNGDKPACPRMQR